MMLGTIMSAPRSRENRERFMDNPDDARHGTLNGYSNLRCRCDRCREANRLAQKEYLDRNPIQREKNRERATRRRLEMGMKPRRVKGTCNAAPLGCSRLEHNGGLHRTEVNGQQIAWRSSSSRHAELEAEL